MPSTKTIARVRWLACTVTVVWMRHAAVQGQQRPEHVAAWRQVHREESLGVGLDLGDVLPGVRPRRGLRPARWGRGRGGLGRPSRSRQAVARDS